MTRTGLITLAVTLTFLAVRPGTAGAEWVVNLQGAAVFTGMNDVVAGVEVRF